MTDERIKKAKEIFRKNGMIVKTAILKKNKFCSKDIAELISVGVIERIKTGYYIWSAAVSELGDMEIAAAVIIDGVVCLHSAASYYELTTINPLSVDIAVLARGKNPLAPDYPPVTIYRMEKQLFEIGIDEINTQYRIVRIYNKERVVCDFFRLRNKLGEDIALEVLRSYMSGTKNIQRLYEYADKMRVKKGIKPYVEALL